MNKRAIIRTIFIFITLIISFIFMFITSENYSLTLTNILFLIFITFISSIMDIKKDSNKLNDILFIIVCILISLVHYRYYLDPRFIHNLLSLDINSVILQNSFKYVCQYYFIFSIMLFVLLIHKKISNIKIK